MTKPNEERATIGANRAPPEYPETPIINEALGEWRAALNQLSEWRNEDMERTAKEAPDTREHLLKGMQRAMNVAQAGFHSVERFSEAHQFVADEMRQLQGVQMDAQSLEEARASLTKRSISLSKAAEGHNTAAMHACTYFDELSARYWKIHPIKHGASPLVKH